MGRSFNRKATIFLFLLFLAVMPYFYFWSYQEQPNTPDFVDPVGQFNISKQVQDDNGVAEQAAKEAERQRQREKEIEAKLKEEREKEREEQMERNKELERQRDIGEQKEREKEREEREKEKQRERENEERQREDTNLTDSISGRLSTNNSDTVVDEPPDPYNGIKLVIGIASMQRGSPNNPRSTLLNTLSSVVSKITVAERDTTRIVVFNLQTPPEDHDQIKTVEEKYKDDILSGFIEVVANWEGYGDLLNPNLIEQTHNDSMGRILWRSKENLDFAFVVDYCSKIAEFILFLEDDVKAANNFISKTLHYFNEPPLNDKGSWLFFSLYTPYPQVRDKVPVPFGCCTQAIVFQARDMPALVSYIKERYAKDPVDWLLRDYLTESKRNMYIAIPNLFQHDTTVSTLAEKNFVHTSPSFREN